MTWFDVLKVISLLEGNQLRDKLPNFQTAQEKGYPSILDNLTFVADLTEDGTVMSYTAVMEFGKFYFVGKGYFSHEFRGSDCLPVGDGRSGTLAGALSGDQPCLTTDLCARGCYGAAAVLVGLVWQAGRFSGTAPLLRDV